MGSINSRPLKAYVRFDGSGRIVAGSLILRKNKPKVGKWKEIPAYECCNPTTTTSTTAAPITTTSTTVAPTTTTTTTVGYFTWQMAASNISAEDACNGGNSGTVTLYTLEPMLDLGVVLYIDSELSITVTDGFYAYSEGITSYGVTGGAGEITSDTACV